MTDINSFIAVNRITMTATARTATLRRGARRLEVPLGTNGAAVGGGATLPAIFTSLAITAAGIKGAATMESWCAERGLNGRNKRHEDLYKRAEHQTSKLKKFLGDDLFAALLLNATAGRS